MKRRPIPADELRTLYWGHRLTRAECARHFGVLPATIWRHMKSANIPARPRGRGSDAAHIRGVSA